MEFFNRIGRKRTHYRFLMLIAEWDRGKGWNDGSTQSCAHWLNWKCGIDMGAAREKVRTARALANLPSIAAAMKRGELTMRKSAHSPESPVQTLRTP